MPDDDPDADLHRRVVGFAERHGKSYDEAVTAIAKSQLFAAVPDDDPDADLHRRVVGFAERHGKSYDEALDAVLALT